MFFFPRAIRILRHAAGILPGSPHPCGAAAGGGLTACPASRAFGTLGGIHAPRGFAPAGHPCPNCRSFAVSPSHTDPRRHVTSARLPLTLNLIPRRSDLPLRRHPISPRFFAASRPRLKKGRRIAQRGGQGPSLFGSGSKLSGLENRLAGTTGNGHNSDGKYQGRGGRSKK